MADSNKRKLQRSIPGRGAAAAAAARLMMGRGLAKCSDDALPAASCTPARNPGRMRTLQVSYS